MANRVQAAGAAFVRLRPLLAAPPPYRDEPAWSSLRLADIAGAKATDAATMTTTRTTTPESGARAAALSFRGAGFSYPAAARPTLVEVDLGVPAGTFVAVTGPVGSGKSALARLAAGIYPPDEGEVLLDGTPAARLARTDRTRRIGYLGQEPHLFSGTVAENVMLSADTPVGGAGTWATVDRAVDRAALAGDIVSMPEGLRTQIGELGVRVSGGQRQRIALARALAASGTVPGLLVLDDPFSAVDVTTEAAIASSLRTALAGEATILLCSHRLASFPQADRIVVLDRGRIEEEGTHAQLLRAGGLYARIFRAQARLAAADDALPEARR
jgi:ATP-binding cassette, subfamily B, multidrug efflux pump